MKKFLLSLTLFTALLGAAFSVKAQTSTENFTSTPVGEVPPGWEVSSNTSVQVYQRPGTCSINDKGLQTPGVGKNAPTGMILPTTTHVNGSDIRIDFTVFVFDANLKCLEEFQPFPCPTFVRAYIVSTSWTDETKLPPSNLIYASLPNYQITNANANNTVLFNNVVLPAGVTQYRIMLDFKTADNGNCSSGNTKFIFDDFSITTTNCTSCGPVANADYFNSDLQNLFEGGATSFNGNLYGGYAPWATAAPAGYSTGSVDFPPAVEGGLDYDANNSPLNAVTYTLVPGSLTFVSGPACGSNPSLGSVVVNQNGTFTYTRGNICVTSVTFLYTLSIGGITTPPTLVTIDMPGEEIVLPVTYASFTATRANNNQVVLEWETAMEENNKGFHVQRNVDGAWKNIGFVFSQANNGNSSEVLKYAFKDANNSKGISQYRILQVDIDGKGKYSQIRSVHGLETAARVVLFPNPSHTGSFNLLFEDATSVRDVVVSDVSGRVVKQFKSVSGSTLTVDGLIDGFYTVQVANRTSGTASVEKVIIKKR